MQRQMTRGADTEVTSQTTTVVLWFCAFLAMLVAMVIGMAVGLVLFFPLGVAFGAMEVMLPTMFTGMFSGMVVGMWAAMMPLGGLQAVAAGAVCGLVGVNVIWILNNSLRGVQEPREGA